MSTHILKEILQGLTENGFKSAVFAKSDGLLLAGASTLMNGEKSLAPVIAMFSEVCADAKEELSLTSKMQEIKIKFGDATIICRNILIEDAKFFLAVVAPPEENFETLQYQAKLLDWAIENANPVLKKLLTL